MGFVKWLRGELGYSADIAVITDSDGVQRNALLVTSAEGGDQFSAPLSFGSFGDVTKDVIKASAGDLYAIRATNSNAAIRYLQLHDKATDPIAGEVPVLSFAIPATGSIEIGSNWLSPSEHFEDGIAFAISTTAGTFTDSATANQHTVNARYR